MLQQLLLLLLLLLFVRRSQRFTCELSKRKSAKRGASRGLIPLMLPYIFIDVNTHSPVRTLAGLLCAVVCSARDSTGYYYYLGEEGQFFKPLSRALFNHSIPFEQISAPASSSSTLLLTALYYRTTQEIARKSIVKEVRIRLSLSLCSISICFSAVRLHPPLR
jgi:hypothetical protein